MNKIINFFSVRPKIRRFLNSYFQNNLAFDIKYNLRMRSLNSTCDYIEEHMAHVPLIDNEVDALDFAIDQISIEGIICEFGVFKGKSMNHIARRCKQEVHAFDSFEGLPEAWVSAYKKGYFAVNKLPSFEKNVVVHKGLFDETLPGFVEKYNGNISFIHIDCDLYSSTKTVFDFLNKQIVAGTVIIFDEYFNYPLWEQHEFKAFQEFVSENEVEYEYFCYNSRPFGSKVGVKITKRK